MMGGRTMAQGVLDVEGWEDHWEVELGMRGFRFSSTTGWEVRIVAACSVYIN